MIVEEKTTVKNVGGSLAFVIPSEIIKAKKYATGKEYDEIIISFDTETGLTSAVFPNEQSKQKKK